jgi:hypothetical protein
VCRLKNKEQDKPDIEAAKAAFQERQQKCKDEALKNIETLNRYSVCFYTLFVQGVPKKPSSDNFLEKMTH